MDLQVGRQRAHRREGLARLKLAGDERLRGRKDDLVENRGPRLKGEPE
jgi:hypothetical protein